jgi:hypothetical protein
MGLVQAPSRSPDQDELDALIEEARRRAWRRRRWYGLAVVAAVLVAGGLYLGFSGGGGGGGGSTSQGGGGEGGGQASPLSQARASSVFRQQFTKCPATSGSGRPPGAGNWSGSAAGISCARAAHVLPRVMRYPPGVATNAEAIRNSPPSRYVRNGFKCLAFPLGDGGGWHELCARGNAAVSFYFTP